MSAGRIVIGGTDVTDFIAAIAAAAPPFTAGQWDVLSRLFAEPAPAATVTATDGERSADIRQLANPTRARRRPMAA